MSRRDFITAASLAAAALALPSSVRAQTPAPKGAAAGAGDGAPAAGGPTHPLIDIHMHQTPDAMRGRMPEKKGGDGKAKKGGSAARTEAQFLVHQKAINAVGSVILGGNDYEFDFIKKDPSRYVRFASAGQAGGDRAAAVESALKNGARGIGEHRWEGDIPFSWRILDMARDFNVPILFHFQEANYAGNPGVAYADFYKVIEKYPTVNFIGHAIDWWGAIDKNYSSKGGTYPRGRVTPGGLTDVWLGRYPNLHADLSATSGNTALLRDPDFAKDFVNRHQDKLMFGSDCPCTTGNSATCWSVIKLVALNQLQLSDEVKKKIYLTNAQKLLKLNVA
jgi:predicted TIM-barrel fold metal-dependent hydrolase